MIGKLTIAASVVPLTALLSAGCAASAFFAERQPHSPRSATRRRRRIETATETPGLPVDEGPCAAALGSESSKPAKAALG